MPLPFCAPTMSPGHLLVTSSSLTHHPHAVSMFSKSHTQGPKCLVSRSLRTNLTGLAVALGRKHPAEQVPPGPSLGITEGSVGGVVKTTHPTG